MRIVVLVTVSQDRYDYHGGIERQTDIQTEDENPESWDWSSICHGLVTDTIKAYRDNLAEQNEEEASE